MYNSITISSGHGKYVRGAAGNPGLDEVDEARLVVEHLANELIARGVEVQTFHDDVSKSQSENLTRIVDWHNSKPCEVALSIHFNAYSQCTKPMGTECLYLTQHELAQDVADTIASTGFINRGAKKRTDLKFLNSTDMPAILVEVCFVDSTADCDLYIEQFHNICCRLADTLAGVGGDVEIEPPPPVQDDVLFYAKGRCSHFGGPDDTGVSPSEGLAFIFSVDDAPQLFLPFQPEGTTGLARRLNPYIHYVACRWDYSVTPKPSLLEHVAMVRAPRTGLEMKAFPADWGPHEEKTGRVADLSPGLMDDLQITTDDEVEVIYPYVPED